MKILRGFRRAARGARRNEAEQSCLELVACTVVEPDDLFPGIVALRSLESRNRGFFSSLVLCADGDRLHEEQRRLLECNGVEFLDLRDVAAEFGERVSENGILDTPGPGIRWVLPEYFWGRGQRYSLLVDPHTICVGAVEPLREAIDRGNPSAFCWTRKAHGLDHQSVEQLEGELKYRVPRKAQIERTVAFFDNSQMAEAGFFQEVGRAWKQLAKRAPAGDHERLALSIVAPSLGAAMLPEGMAYRARAYHQHLQPAEELKILSLADNPKPWKPLEMKHVQRMMKNRHALTPFVRDVWLSYARDLPGFSDFTEQRSGGPLGRLKLANQLERGRVLAEEEEKKKQLDVPYYVWPGEHGVSLTKAAHFAALKGGSQYDFLFLPKHSSERLFVFFSGYADRKRQRPPIFQRWSWADRFPGHTVYFSDPGLHKDEDLSVAYYAGAEGSDYMAVIGELIRDLARGLDVPEENIVTYGSSAGGFASLRSALYLKGARHIAINPQTDSARHRQGKVDRAARVLYGATTWRELPDDYRARFTAHHREILENAGEIMLLQNVVDRFHYENHFVPFVEFARSEGLEHKMFVQEFTHNAGHRGGESKAAFAQILNFLDIDA